MTSAAAPIRRAESPRLLERLAPRHAALAGILMLSAVLNLRSLSQNGYANSYYSGAVRSMLESWHNFFFASADPGGLVTVDKPPLGLWLQAASAKVFGFSSMSMLVPEAICGVLAVALLYRIVSPRFGAPAALLSALALAVFPSLVAVSRDNLPDALLILFMVAACGAALNAVEKGSLRWLLWCAVLVGLAFNTKMLAAFLIVPGIVLAYALCAPGPFKRRALHILAAGAMLAVVSSSWLAVVQLTPADSRPYVGSTEDNNGFSLAFNYNGVGRVAGQDGGPGGNGGGQGGPPGGGTAQPPAGFGGATGATALPAPPGGGQGGPPGGGPGGGGGPGSSVFGGPTGLTRLFGESLGGQGGWMVPFGLVGIFGIGLVAGTRRRDPKLAGLIVFGGWFIAEAVILSFSKGIVHPYYVSAMGPGLAVMVGAGALALATLIKRGAGGTALAAVAVGATVATQAVLLVRDNYMTWWIPLLAAAGAAGVLFAARDARSAKPALIATTLALLVAPAAYATTVWDSPVSGTFPSAGNSQAFGPGGGGPGGAQSADSGLAEYVTANSSGTRWDVLTQSSMEADPLILQGVRAGAIGGFNGSDLVLTADDAARMVADGNVRFFALGGAFPGRSPNGATTAVEAACTEVPSSAYSSGTASVTGPSDGPMGQTTLYDCAGQADAIAAA